MLRVVLYPIKYQRSLQHVTQQRPNQTQTTDPHRPRSLRDVAREAWRDTRAVLRHRLWLNMSLGYTLYCAVVGVFAFWGPKAGRALYDMKGTSADVWFGGVTVLTGILGGLGGGALLDYIGATMRNANLLCALSNLLGCGALLVAFLAPRTSFYAFIALFALGELMIFGIQVLRARWCWGVGRGGGKGLRGKVGGSGSLHSFCLQRNTTNTPTHNTKLRTTHKQPATHTQPPSPVARRRHRHVVRAAVAAAARHLDDDDPDPLARRRALAPAARLPADAPRAGQAARRRRAAVAN